MRKLVRQLSSPRPSVRRRASAALVTLADKARSADETPPVDPRVERFESALAEIRSVTGAIKVPNGTTKKIARIADAAFA